MRAPPLFCPTAGVRARDARVRSGHCLRHPAGSAVSGQSVFSLRNRSPSRRSGRSARRPIPMRRRPDGIIPAIRRHYARPQRDPPVRVARLPFSPMCKTAFSKYACAYLSGDLRTCATLVNQTVRFIFLKNQAIRLSEHICEKNTV